MPRVTAPPIFLLASSDEVLRRIVEEAVTLLSCSVALVRSGSDLLARSHAASLRLAMLDQDLSDVTGLDVARALHHEAPGLPFLLFGEDLSIAITVQAMKLGAVTVLEKPVEGSEIVAAIRSVKADGPSPPRRTEAPTASRSVARSTAERWARCVLKGCEADGDLRTLGAWASFAGLSPSSLCEMCRLVGVQPLHARDLTRLLNAVVRSCRSGSRIDELLDISDRRTLKGLMKRAGLDSELDRRGVSVEQFLAAQRFVPSSNPGIASLRALLLQ
jgi:ActR/RegA family two-component response regulator